MGVYSASPRLDRRLLDAIAHVDDSSLPIAETNRRARQIAAALQLPRPSYESVRLHVHLIRREQELARRKRETLLRVALYQAPVSALYDVVSD
jgi:hypothetical protein